MIQETRKKADTEVKNKYNFNKIKAGESKQYKASASEFDKYGSLHCFSKLYASLTYYKKITGRKFKTKRAGEVLIVKRIE